MKTRHLTGLSREQSLALVERLAYDKDFYARFKANPASALLEILTAHVEFACFSAQRLPSQSALRENLDRYADSARTAGSMSVFRPLATAPRAAKSRTARRSRAPARKAK